MSKIIINKYGDQVWYNKKDQIHRLNKPAMINLDGSMRWFRNGRLHREDGPAAIHPNGSFTWWFENEIHRLDGPAVNRGDGTELWFKHGKRHCADGPAVRFPDATYHWWLEGICVNVEVNKWFKENKFPHYALWTDGQKIMFRLAFSGIKS